MGCCVTNVPRNFIRNSQRSSVPRTHDHFLFLFARIQTGGMHPECTRLLIKPRSAEFRDFLILNFQNSGFYLKLLCVPSIHTSTSIHSYLRIPRYFYVCTRLDSVKMIKNSPLNPKIPQKFSINHLNLCFFEIRTSHS